MTTETPQPAYLSVRDLAVYLGVSVRTSYNLVASGEVPSLRIGGQHRIPRAELDRHLARRLKGGRPA